MAQQRRSISAADIFGAFSSVSVRWLKSLAARITFFVIPALVMAQALSILVLTQNSENDRSMVVTENFLRQAAGLAKLFNSSSAIDRREYLRSVTSPGLNFWIDTTPAVAQSERPTANRPGGGLRATLTLPKADAGAGMRVQQESNP